MLHLVPETNVLGILKITQHQSEPPHTHHVYSCSDEFTPMTDPCWRQKEWWSIRVYPPILFGLTNRGRWKWADLHEPTMSLLPDSLLGWCPCKAKRSKYASCEPPSYESLRAIWRSNQLLEVLGSCFGFEVVEAVDWQCCFFPAFGCHLQFPEKIRQK